MVNGNYTIDCLPVDMRWAPFEYGNDGLNWVASTTFRSKTSLEAGFPGESFSGTTDIEVRDYWDSEKNEVWINKKLVRSQKNPFGYPPFVIAAPATGFMLRDKGYIAHESEDLLFLIRELYDEINRSVSIEQTIGMETIQPRKQDIVEVMDGRPAAAPPKIGEAVKRKKGFEWQLMPVRDLNQAFFTGRADLNRAIEMGGVNAIDLGNVSQTVSAVWITAQTGIRKKFSNPRLACMAEAEQLLARMIIDQALKGVTLAKEGNTELAIGVSGRKRKYTSTQLGDPEKYTITYKLMSRDKMQEIANLAQFEAAGNLPMRWRLENILKADDPDGIMRELAIEEGEQADPAIKLHKLALRYVEEAEEIQDEDDANAKLIEAKMFMERGVAIIKQRQQPAQPALPEKARVPQVEEPKGGGQTLVPLLGRGGVGGSRAGQREQVITPEEVAG